MFENFIKKYKNKKATRIDSLIGQNTEIEGEIRFSGGVHIDGKVKGKVIGADDGSSLLSQSEHGEIEGEDLPQIGPLLVDMQVQRRYILAGILKVNIFRNIS